LAESNKSTQKRLERLNGIETVCKSLVKYEILEQLRDNHRYERFLAVIQYCSSRNMTMEQTVNFVRDKFGAYISTADFNVKLFKKMITEEIDIAEAWGQGEDGDDIANVMIKNKAIQLALNADDISVIETYNKIYNNSENTTSGGSNNTVVRLNVTR
jgi:hypothetical protein